MEISFYLQAIPTLTGGKSAKPGFKVVEMYEMATGRTFARDSGVTKEVLGGRVDADIIKENEKYYVPFKALVEAQFDALYAKAIAAPGTKVYPVEVE